MPISDHEMVVAEARSFTGQYLRPLLERASVRPVAMQAKPTRTRSPRAKSRGAAEEVAAE